MKESDLKHKDAKMRHEGHKVKSPLPPFKKGGDVIEEANMNEFKEKRDMMKCPVFKEGMEKSDQSNGVPHPPLGKKYDSELIVLDGFESKSTYKLEYLYDKRRSVRKYDNQKQMTQAQLAFLVWSAAGIQCYRGTNNIASFRPTPSGGARHPFEIYVAVQNVEGLKEGLYHYAPEENVSEKKVTLTYVKSFYDYKEQINNMIVGQVWGIDASVVIFVTCIPYRAEWRYNMLSHRVMLIDLGHLGQNVMLSAVDLGLGSCCIAAYDQILCDEFLEIDGVDEYTVYVIPVGHVE